MIGFKPYEMHTALNLHFGGRADYDYFKYNGKTRVKEESFQKSKFKWQFIGLEKKYDRLLYMMYLVYRSNKFGYTTPQYMFKKASNLSTTGFYDDTYSFIRNTLKNDLETILERCEGDPEQLLVKQGLYPKLYALYKSNDISVESLILFDYFIIKVLTSDASDDIIAWPDELNKLSKIRQFVLYFGSDIFLQLLDES